MTPFALERQPKNSLMTVVFPDTETMVLVFPPTRYVHVLCVVGVAGAIGLMLALIVGTDPLGWRVRGVGKLVAVASALMLLAFMLLLGRHRLTLTRESVTRSLGVFGLVFPLDRVQFKEVTSIECRSDKFGAVLLLHRRKGGHLFIEGFRFAEERDWVADGLRGLWDDFKATRKAVNGKDRPAARRDDARS